MTKKKANDKSTKKPKDENIKKKTKETEENDLQSQLEQAQQSAKDNWDKLLRSQAEMENLKRRNAKDLGKCAQICSRWFC